MKNELKISTLSIVCVLCTAVAMPAFGVSSVRSLGGTGTYTSASSAAAAKSDKASSATNSVRGGSMRVNNSASASRNATRSSSTRTATTPRLSIGKYLAGSSAISGGSSNRVEIDKIEGNLSSATTEFNTAITNLAASLGLSADDIKDDDVIYITDKTNKIISLICDIDCFNAFTASICDTIFG